MLTVIRGLENWRHLLKSTRFKFEIWMDYKNLEYFIKAQKLNRKQARQTLYLSFILKHILGIKIEKTDGLSRRLDLRVGIENNNSNQVFIKDYQICNLYGVIIKEPKIEIVEKIKKVKSKDKEVLRVVEKIMRARVRNLRGDK